MKPRPREMMCLPFPPETHTWRIACINAVMESDRPADAVSVIAKRFGLGRFVDVMPTQFPARPPSAIKAEEAIFDMDLVEDAEIPHFRLPSPFGTAPTEEAVAQPREAA